MDKSLYLDHLNLLPIPGEVFFYPNFFDKAESDLYFDDLNSRVVWKQDGVKIYGKTVLQPGFTAFYGDEHISYSYSGITVNAMPWIDTLSRIKENIESKFEEKFNTCMLNQYRDGRDGMGWHRDHEKSLGNYPFIASVSFGASRIFQFRHYVNKIPIISVDLSHGSLLIMKAETQHLWEHRLPKTVLATGPRINLTFRLVVK
jgi:alkylated DNA repair dioxygenase AlkB